MVGGEVVLALVLLAGWGSLAGSRRIAGDWQRGVGALWGWWWWCGCVWVGGLVGAACPSAGVVPCTRRSSVSAATRSRRRCLATEWCWYAVHAPDG